MDHFVGLDVSVKETSVCIVDDTGRSRAGSEGGERAGSVVGSSLTNSALPLQADWAGSRAAVGMAFQRSRRSRLASDLCRDAAHAGGVAVYERVMAWCNDRGPLAV